MTYAICEDCAILVPAEVTHNGVCAVGHYVHCGWGHQCSTSDLIDGAAADRIQDLEARLEAMTLQHEAALEAVGKANDKVKALVEAAAPFLSQVQNGDYSRQLRQHEALRAALAALDVK